MIWHIDRLLLNGKPLTIDP